jgi:hypothetical protein
MSIFSFVKAGKKIFDTVKSVSPNVGNLKKNQETIKKITNVTDQYVTKAGSVDPSLKEALRKAGSKSLQKTDKILRKNKKDGGRMGLKFGSGTKRKSNIEKIKETFGPKKTLSPKQMKIAKLAGNPKKIDAPDFKKLRGRG